MPLTVWSCMGVGWTVDVSKPSVWVGDVTMND